MAHKVNRPAEYHSERQQENKQMAEEQNQGGLSCVLPHDEAASICRHIEISTMATANLPIHHVSVATVLANSTIP